MKVSKIKTQNLCLLSLVFVLGFLVLPPKPVYAGLILGAPKYAGLSSGLVGYWSFNGPDMAGNIAYDRGGTTTENGTLTNGPKRTIGKIGQALSFDGVDDYVAITSTSYGTTHSASFWYYDIANIDLENFIGGPLNHYALIYSGGSIYYNNGDINVNVPYTFTPGQWHYATVVRSETSVKFYINGSQIGTTQTLATNNDLTLGAIGGQQGGGNVIQGILDDVRIYNRALSADEIKRLYKIGATLKLGVSKSNDTLQNGLVGWWTFDAQDMYGNIAYDKGGTTTDENGTLTNMDAIKARVPGRIGQALNFDGATDFVAVNSTPLDTNDSFTIAGWVYTNVAGGAIYGRSDSNVDGYQLTEDAGVNCGASTNKMYLTIGSPAPGYVGLCGLTNIQTQKWYHVAGVYNSVAQTMKIYVNGADDTGSFCGGCGPTTPPSSFPKAGGPATIGANGVNATNKFNGYLDDTRIYNRALSADEVKRLYRIGATLKLGVSKSNDTLQNGLVGWWTFDAPDLYGNIAYDKGGTTTENGTFTNMDSIKARVPGKIGQALSFDGSSSFIDVSTSANLDLDIRHTVSAWVKTNAKNVTQNIFLHGYAPCCGTEYGLQIKYNAGGGTYTFAAINDSYGAGAGTFQGNLTVQPDIWYHVVNVWDGNKIYLYVNGVLDASVTVATPIQEFSNVNGIGSIKNGGSFAGGYFNGLIDDVRVYNRALTADEIKRLYNLSK